ncbi:MAG: hypothetical protein IMW85_00915 [Thermicanus sp.]|nr:hypothetical protein [Thermicanus sp.]
MEPNSPQQVEIVGIPQVEIVGIPSEDYSTPNGTIRIKYEMTLGDIVVSISIALLTTVLVLKWMIDSVWRGRR